MASDTAANLRRVFFLQEGLKKQGIKGVTKPVELHGRLAAAPSVDPFGRERLGLSLETAIDRNEFGVAWNAPNQSGGNYLGDEVTLKADLTFVRQEN